VEEAVERIQNGQLKFTTRNGDAEVPEQRSPQEKYHPHTMDTTFFNRRATRLLSTYSKSSACSSEDGEKV
jgi:hypothetical protein